MKIILLFTCTLTLLCSSVCSRAQNADPVDKANDANAEKADSNLVDKDVAKFLVKSADARMMDIKEGNLAIKKGTTPSIRKYGQLMVKDQAVLLQKIKKLAASRNISLPVDISEEKQDGREELTDKNGTDFDEKFTKMMKKDHERDVNLFEKATKCRDKGVSSFAQTYLPMIQSHLDKINTIKQETKS